MKYCSKILFFYVIFYAALVGFFGAMLAVFYQTLDGQEGSVLFGSNPRLEFKPNVESTLIRYNSRDKESTLYWQNELDKFLAPYTKTEKPEHAQKCGHFDKPAEGKFCEFVISDTMFAPCTKDFGYGYDSRLGGPCIFLTLTKVIHGWVPDYYNSTTAPNSIPNGLLEEMRRAELMSIGMPVQHLVWVDCTGENPADVENLGIIHYYPYRGFRENYFPFPSIEGYLRPLVAVHFESPKRGVLINIECRAWAPNIHHDRVSGQGLVHFELLID